MSSIFLYSIFYLFTGKRVPSRISYSICIHIAIAFFCELPNLAQRNAIQGLRNQEDMVVEIKGEMGTAPWFRRSPEHFNQVKLAMVLGIVVNSAAFFYWVSSTIPSFEKILLMRETSASLFQTQRRMPQFSLLKNLSYTFRWIPSWIFQISNPRCLAIAKRFWMKYWPTSQSKFEVKVLIGPRTKVELVSETPGSFRTKFDRLILFALTDQALLFYKFPLAVFGELSIVDKKLSPMSDQSSRMNSISVRKQKKRNLLRCHNLGSFFCNDCKECLTARFRMKSDFVVFRYCLSARIFGISLISTLSLSTANITEDIDGNGQDGPVLQSFFLGKKLHILGSCLTKSWSRLFASSLRKNVLTLFPEYAERKDDTTPSFQTRIEWEYFNCKGV